MEITRNREGWKGLLVACKSIGIKALLNTKKKQLLSTKKKKIVSTDIAMLLLIIVFIIYAFSLVFNKFFFN